MSTWNLRLWPYLEIGLCICNEGSGKESILDGGGGSAKLNTSPLRRGEGKRTQRRRSCERGGKDWVCAASYKPKSTMDFQKLPERHRTDWNLQKKTTQQTPDFRFLGSRTIGKGQICALLSLHLVLLICGSSPRKQINLDIFKYYFDTFFRDVVIG